MQLDARHEKARLLMQTGTKARFGVSRRSRLMRPAPCTPVASGATGKSKVRYRHAAPSTVRYRHVFGRKPCLYRTVNRATCP